MTDRKRVLIGLPIIAKRNAPYLKRFEEAGFEITLTPLDRAYNEDEMVELIPDFFATIASLEPYTKRVFDAAEQLRVVARFGVGYDQIDVAEATRHKVAVAMAFGANHEAVADQAFALMAGSACQALAFDRQVRECNWDRSIRPSLWKATVGIVGLGRIGRALARRCQGFEMRVLAYDVQPDATYTGQHGIDIVPLDTLLREADFVSLHAPLAKETENLIGEAELAKMKPTAYLINTARGGLVDEDALYRALRAGQIAGAGLDVFKQEPPVGSPLLELDNVLLSPHIAGLDVSAEHAMANRCIDSILAIAAGQDPGQEYLVNPEVLDDLR